MNRDWEQAVRYLRTPGSGLYRWSENGAVLVWHDGTTIAFREEVAQILESLGPNGLPPFGAIVLLLAACRGKLPAVSELAIDHAWVSMDGQKHATMRLSPRIEAHYDIEAALIELKKVSELPGELRSGSKAKCILANAAFETAQPELHTDARAVLRGLRETLADAQLNTGHIVTSSHYLRLVSIAAQGLRRHTTESLALRLRTGLDALPVEADATLPAAERARRIIEELSRDTELGAVGRAARELMAAVRLPRRLGERERLAIGGVADITNRGPLDRLLLSELAHDDLTLSVRVALNEALYLQREPPMREPPGTLAILLDSGVRLWGVPRVLATAVALALIARDKQHSEILVWRAHGHQLQPVDLLSRSGLTQHLSALEPAAHAGDAIAAFADATARNTRTQSVLITHRDALRDPEFRRAVADNPVAPEFIAAVDRDGSFELHAKPLAHRPPVCQADLNLDAVLNERAAVPAIHADADPDLPVSLGLNPFPFLLPVAGTVEYWTAGTDGFNYAVMSDRRLVQYGSPAKGARVLATDLPPGKTIWMECDGTEIHLVKAAASQRPARLVSLTLPNGLLQVSDLASGPAIHAIYRYGDVIVLIRRNDLRAHSLHDGRLVGQALNPHSWVEGRFVRGTNQFHFAVWDGERVKLEPVTVPAVYLASSIASVFDRKGRSGPWILCRSGQVLSTDSGEKIDLAGSRNRPAGIAFSGAQVSRDGNQLLITPPSEYNNIRFWHTFDLEKRTWSRVSSLEYFDRNPALPTWNLFRTVESIAVVGGCVAMCGRKHRWRSISPGTGGRLMINDLPSGDAIPSGTSFRELRKTTHGCSIKVAELPNGAKAFLDSRGLLHLKSTDPTLAEVSIVLADGGVAGWTSDGHLCGPPFFFDSNRASEPEAVFERILKIIAGL